MSDGFGSRLCQVQTEVEAEIPAKPVLMAQGPDREIIVICSKFIDLEVHRRRVLKSATTIEAEELVQQQLAATDEKYKLMLSRLCDLQAATLEGLSAKAHALNVTEPLFRTGEVEGSAVGGRILASMLHDLLIVDHSRSCPKPET